MFTVTSFTGGIAQTNSYLLQSSTGTLLVDAPEGAAAWLAAQKVQIDALLLTHHHFDHVLDAAAIQAEQGCPVYAFAQLSKDLTLETLYGAVTGTQFAVRPFVVDHVLGTLPSVQILGLEWKLYHVPGHSTDSLCFHQEELGLLFDGDVLMQEGIGRADFPGGSMHQLLDGIEAKLLILPDATVVYPGHGPETTIGHERAFNPYLS